MEKLNITETAWTPSFGMPAGHPCARTRALGAAAGLVAKDAAAIVCVKAAFWGSPAWRPLTS